MTEAEVLNLMSMTGTQNATGLGDLLGFGSFAALNSCTYKLCNDTLLTCEWDIIKDVEVKEGEAVMSHSPKPVAALVSCTYKLYNDIITDI